MNIVISYQTRGTTELGIANTRYVQDDTLKKVQEKAVQMVSGLKITTYQEKCEELHLQSLVERRDNQDMALGSQISD